MKHPPTTVFVVDSDGVSREAVRNVVRRMNLRCRTYASGQRFLDDRDRSTPGCVVCELQVPDIGGLEIQRRLDAEGATLPVILLTSRATVAIAVRAMRSGAAHLLEKPPREEDLWESIQEAVWLDRRRRALMAATARAKRRALGLTRGERDVWRLWARGADASAIAEQLEISIRAVESRQNSALRKLGIKNAMRLLPFMAGMFEDEPGRASEPAAIGVIPPHHWNRDSRKLLDARSAAHSYHGKKD